MATMTPRLNLPSAWGRALGARNNVLDRVRFLFLVFLIVNAAVSAFLLLKEPQQTLGTLFASYGLTYIVLWGVLAYLHQRNRPWMDAVAGLALFAAGSVAFQNPIRAYVLFYGALLFRSLFGRAFSVATMSLLILATMLAASAANTLNGGGNPLDVLQVMVNIPAFAATAWLMHSVKSTLERYIEALRRERVLVKAGDELAAADTPAEVYRVALEAALDMGSTARQIAVGISSGDARSQKLVAAGPPARLVDSGRDRRLATLPELFQQSITELKPMTGMAVAPWSEAEPTGPGHAIVAPLLIEGKVTGLVWLLAPGALPELMEDGFARLAVSVSLAIERVNLAEDNRRQIERVRASEARFRSLVQNSSDVITTLNEDGKITYISPAVEKLLGFEKDELDQVPLWTVIIPDDLGKAQDVFQKLVRQRTQQELLGARWRHKDGSHRFMETVLTNQLTDPDLNAVVLNTRDVTDRKQLEENLRQMAYYDSLTGLPNRILFKERVARSLAYHKDQRGRLGVLFLDVDDFKHVNDSLGHAAGDQLLQAVAKRLHDCVGPSDTVARFGGDEFAVLVDNVHDASYVAQVAERILAAFKAGLKIGRMDMVMAVSIGIAISGPQSTDPEELLRNADVAMYRAKGAGKRTFEVFEESMHAAALERLELEHDLRLALERDELILRFQPIVWIESDQIAGVEALVRWQHPVKGVIEPDRFITLAEETGLITPLGMWVLEHSLAELRKWDQEHPDRPLKLGVNLSVRQLQRANIAAEIRQVLKQSGVPPDRLTLEITESAVMRDGEEAAQKLQKLRQAGMKVAIDDFGTGYSSLSYLARFPIDVIKIDKAFVKRVGKGTKNSELLKAIVGLGHSLGVDIVAEGIETANQAKVLEPLGCRGQGYYYSKPLQSEEIMDLLKRPTVHSAVAPPAERKKRGAGKRPILELLEGSGPA